MKNKILTSLDRLEDMILVIMFAAMVITIFVQVIMRYVFNNSLSWSEELGKFLFVWISWFGISIGARRREHIQITMFVDRLSFMPRKIMDIVSELVLIAICAVTAYYGVTLVFSQFGTHYAGIRISMSWGYLSVVVGCVLMILRSAIQIVSCIDLIKKGEIQGKAVEGGGE